MIARVPLQPRLTWSQKRSRPTPNGETTPMPVITTRGRDGLPTWHDRYTSSAMMAELQRCIRLVGGARVRRVAGAVCRSLRICSCCWSVDDRSAAGARSPSTRCCSRAFALAPQPLRARRREALARARASPERLLRSVYVWTAALLLLVICAAWRPIGGEIYPRDGSGAAGCTRRVQLAGSGSSRAAVARTRSARTGGHPIAAHARSRRAAGHRARTGSCGTRSISAGC